MRAERLSSSLIVDAFRNLAEGKPFRFVITRESPEDTAKRIQDQEMRAQSLEQLLGGGTTKFDTLVGLTLKLLSVDWNESDEQFDGEGSLPFYAVLELADGQGNVITTTTGARSVCRKLAIADAQGWLETQPWVKFTRANRTAAGREPFDLVLVATDDAALDNF